MCLALALCLAACSGGDDTNPSESESNSTEATAFHDPNLTEYENEFYGIHNAGQKQALTVLSDTYEISVNEDGNYLTIFYEETSDGYGMNGEEYTITYNYYYKSNYTLADDGVTVSCRFDERYLALDFSEEFTDSVRDEILSTLEPYIGSNITQEEYDSYYALLHGETLKDTGTFGSFYPMVFYGEKTGSQFTVTKVEEYSDDTLRSCVEIGAEEIRQYFNSNDFNSITVYSLDGTPLRGERHYTDGSYGYMEYYATGVQKSDTTYDAQGNIQEQLCYNENGDFLSLRYSDGSFTEYEYDTDGNCTKEIHGDNDGISQTWEYKYENGVLVEEKVVYAPDKNFVYDGLTMVNTYFSNGSARSNATYNIDGTLMEYSEVDENGNYVKTFKSWSNATEETIYENGVRVLATHCYFNGEKAVYTYVNDMERTFTHYAADGTQLAYIEYDENGNVVTEIYN